MNLLTYIVLSIVLICKCFTALNNKQLNFCFSIWLGKFSTRINSIRNHDKILSSVWKFSRYELQLWLLKTMRMWGCVAFISVVHWLASFSWPVLDLRPDHHRTDWQRPHSPQASVIVGTHSLNRKQERMILSSVTPKCSAFIGQKLNFIFYPSVEYVPDESIFQNWIILK